MNAYNDDGGADLQRPCVDPIDTEFDEIWAIHSEFEDEQDFRRWDRIAVVVAAVLVTVGTGVVAWWVA